jgi:hypothetical protein
MWRVSGGDARTSASQIGEVVATRAVAVGDRRVGAESPHGVAIDIVGKDEGENAVVSTHLEERGRLLCVERFGVDGVVGKRLGTRARDDVCGVVGVAKVGDEQRGTLV